MPPAAELGTRAVLKRCIEARAVLAELKQAAELIPNQRVPINTIPLLDAKDSSEIESIVTTMDLLFQHAQDGDNHADPATKEAFRYRKALHQDYQSLTIHRHGGRDLSHAKRREPRPKRKGQLIAELAFS